MSQDVRITEFLAVGRSDYPDEDGDDSDWVEIQNASGELVNLEGWSLSDNPDEPERWNFPGVDLSPGEFLVVFASGKDRTDPESELHLNFELDSGGEFLGLFRPDGSVAYEFSPSYPEQEEDVSYGVAQGVATFAFVVEGDNARYIVPTAAINGTTWTGVGYNDAAWSEGPSGIGHDSGAPVAPDPDNPTNLAMDGTATHTSQLGGFGAGNAIDGDYSNFTHTAAGDNLPSTWELDLEGTFQIQSVVLHNRQSCCGSRLRDITVEVYEDLADDPIYESDLLNPENELGAPTRLDIDFPSEVGGPVVGRYVRVVRTPDPDFSGGAGNDDEADVLSLGEVEVFEGVSGYFSQIRTDVENEMDGVNASLYARFEFDVDDLDAFDTLVLRMKYDDGFIAYLNGQEVARRNAPGNPAWNSRSTASNPDEDAVQFEEFFISGDIDLLNENGNVLAIHALNRSPTDDDFLITPELIGYTIEQDVERFFRNPTPSQPNDDDGFEGFVADTVFSVDRGFFENPFNLEITSATPDAQIRYTLDGSLPTPGRGTVYSGPINISETTIVRALATKPGFEPTNVDTQTYLFLEDVIDSSVMRTSITQNATYGPQMEAALMDLPTISMVTTGNVNNSSEIPTSVEWISPTGGREFQVDAGVKHFGGNVTNFPKKNFRIFFRGEYGARKLRFPLFEGHDRTIPAPESFDQMELRTGSHDMNQRGFYMSNRFTDDSMLDMGNLNPHGQFVHLYWDGTYWGQYHLRERWHDDMHASYFGGEPEDYESINGNRNVGGSFGAGFPYDGTGQVWEEAKRRRSNFPSANRLVDLQHYIDFMLLFNYGNSETEYRTVGPIRESDPGGFKFYLNDADGFTRGVGNRTSVAGPGEFWSALRSARHPDFLTLVGDRIYKHMYNDGAMTPTKMRERLLERCAEIERAFFAEAARWDFRTPSNWESTKNSYVNGVIPGRTNQLLGYLQTAALIPATQAPEFSRNGGDVPVGFPVVLTAPSGEILVTLDGSDPRLPGGAVSPEAISAEGELDGTTILSSNAAARAFVPPNDNLGLSWTERNFNDAAWQVGTTGVGLERSSGYEELIGLDVEAEMYDVNASVYIRVEFDVDDLAGIVRLVLKMKYDDGFIAYINGEEVASRNAPGDATWNSRATSGHSDSLAREFENIDISQAVASLRSGTNVLAIHGMNTSERGGDLLMLPELEASGVEGGITLQKSTIVKARARQGGDWSPLAETTFIIDRSIRVSEIMYHPPTPLIPGEFSSGEYEFIELVNTGEQVIDLDDLRLAGGIRFDFSAGAVPQLPPGEAVIVVRNLDAFQDRYDTAGMLVAGEYEGNLGNGGDLIEIRGPVDEEVHGFEYDDLSLPETDGGGFSLVHLDPTLDKDTWQDADSWAPSGELLGSPGVVEGVDPPVGGFRRIGDANQDSRIDLSDGISLLRALFLGAQFELPCEGAGLDEGGNAILFDPNGDASVDLSDAIYLLEYLFLGGNPPTLGAGCVRIPGCSSACVF
ncbi:MAG: lamin tail domain-containing protein [Planctomycetota bacterium]